MAGISEEMTAAQGEIAVGIRDPDDGDQPLAFAFEEATLRDATLVAVHTGRHAALYGLGRSRSRLRRTLRASG